MSSEARAGQVVAEITAAGGRAMAVRGSVGEPEEVRAMTRQVEAELGPIDLLACNAAAVREFIVKLLIVKLLLDVSWAEYENLLTGETKAVFSPVQAAAPGMVERGAGVIINVSSGLSRQPQVGMAGHSSGKAAVDALTRALALELGPHGTRTGPDRGQRHVLEHWAGAKRRAQSGGDAAQDVAGAILRLAADTASFVTGVHLNVNGGPAMR